MSEQNIEKEQLYKGVFRAEKKDGTVYYRASLTKNGKHISLGSFPDALQAHRAYEQGLLLLSDPSLTLQSYEKVSPLSFEKWVSLINLRDNGLYIGNPIYLGQQLFYYYLSPHHVLKFDMEDLFYYSSHKIMCRGNHYFVADYGMQQTLTSRYGIKSYGVTGVDYIVGRYATDIEAAIAYNKAIDILHSKGVTSNFTPNYVEAITPRRYAEIYSTLDIAPGILNYEPISPNNQ